MAVLAKVTALKLAESEPTTLSEELAAQESAKAADVRRCHEATTLAAQESAKVADVRPCHEATTLAAQESAKAADAPCCHEATTLAAQESAKVADVRRRHEAKMLAASANLAVLANLAESMKLAKPAKESEPAMLLESEELATKELASAKAADDCRRGTLAATTLSEPATAADNRRCALANDRPLQPVCRRAQPCRRTGRRNCPRAPSPIDKALPSPQPTGGGTSPSASTVPTLLAQSSAEANSPSRSETPSLLLPTTASSSPSSQPFDVKMAVSMPSDGGNAGNAHPFRACGPPTPQWTRT